MKTIFSMCTLMGFLSLAMFFDTPSFGELNTRGEIKSKTVNSKGVGVTAEDAVDEALRLAVKQANGVSLEPQMHLAWVGTLKGKADVKLMGASVADVEISGAQYNKIDIIECYRGYVENFNIIELKKSGNEYNATLDVNVYQFETKDFEGRVKVAVMDFDSRNPVAGRIIEDLNSRISSRLVSTTKFDALDRRYIMDYVRERNMMLADDTSIEDKAKLSNRMGAEFMLSGSIRELSVVKFGPNDRRIRVKYIIDYSLVNVATSQVELSDTINDALSDEEIDSIFDPVTRDHNINELSDLVADKAAAQIVSDVTDKVYPVKVAMVSGNRVVLNEGGKRIKAGQIYDVMHFGEEIVDPDTGAKIANFESKAAVVEVTSVQDRVSYAAIVQGEPVDIQSGDLCRVGEFVQGGFAGGLVVGSGENSTGAVSDRAIIGAAKFEKPALAVMALKSEGSGKKYAGELEQQMLNGLRESNKFKMVSRDYLQEYESEINLILAGSPTSELKKMNKLTGADYILAGTLVSYDLSQEEYRIEAINQTTKKYGASVKLDYQVLEMATMEVLYSGTIERYYEDRDIKAMVPDLKRRNTRSIGEKQLNGVINEVVTGELVRELIGDLYPIKVIAMNNGQAVLSQGKTVLKNGVILSVFSEGKDLLDPYTGEVLGKVESDGGRLKVVRVESKLAYADVISGEVKEGDSCKIVSVPEKKYIDDNRKANIPVKSNNGVRMPFD